MKIELPATTMDWLKFILIIVTTISLLWLGLNQWLGYANRVELLSNPCDRCVELNPQVEHCFGIPSQPTVNLSLVQNNIGELQE